MVRTNDPSAAGSLIEGPGRTFHSMPSCLRPVSNRKAAPKPQKAEYMGKYRRFGSSHSARLLQRQPGLPRFFMAACLCSIGIRQFCSCGSHEPFAPKKVAPPMLGRATEPAFIRLFFISAVLHLHVHAAVERIGDTGISADMTLAVGHEERLVGSVTCTFQKHTALFERTVRNIRYH